MPDDSAPDTKQLVIDAVGSFVHAHPAKRSRWDSPVVGFCSVDDPLFETLREVVSPTHALPRELLPGARSVVTFYIPFKRQLAHTNAKGRSASLDWGAAYVETNGLIHGLGQHLQALMAAHGHRSRPLPATHNWNEETLVSDWSHRHVAYIAGLGKFGLNNMLITPKGCCGRLGSFITSAMIDPDPRNDTPACLHKLDGTCSLCTRRCVNQALEESSFDRFRCYEMCLENAKDLRAAGYADVCGKCVVAVPCAHIDPVANKKRAAARR